ncbi:hypothetical protein CI109_105448 [Kwoniella shandongensis]|uniref:Uncharacterized protein n=1 Tax=Kwoniella shandongensis TaxID=1734106 RepID=A0A5M6C2C8_9TREE|nr:uncharacterized protein CI109_002169 [Kwoniella shandongensis]KAA5529278.1 hypothetical protein CI109_002169 [Kwoniella shandongensis]
MMTTALRPPSPLPLDIVAPPPSSMQSPHHHDDLPRTPTTSTRQRSDTMLTTSSSASSFPHLQTPQTPSIIGRLHGNDLSAKPLVESPEEGTDVRPRRQDSYGFGEMLGMSPDSTKVPIARAARSDSQVSEMSIGGMSGIGFSIESDHLAQSPSILQHQPPTSDMHPLPLDLGNPLSPTQPDAVPTLEEKMSRPEAKRTKSSLKAVVRRKLERSKTSFRLLRSGRLDEKEDVPAISTSEVHHNDLLSSNAESPSIPSSRSTTPVVRPRRSRLKSLLSLSMSRTQSSASIRSSISFSSQATSQSGYQQGATVVPVPGDTSLRDVEERFPGNISSVRARDFGTLLLQPDDDLNHPSSRNEPMIAEQIPGVVETRVVDRKGKGRARSHSATWLSQPHNAWLPRRASTSDGLLSDDTERMHSIAANHATGLESPTPLSDINDEGLAALFTCGLEEEEEPKVDWFDTMLPRELKVLVLRKLVEGFSDVEGDKRWDCEAGGRRELVKLSRVSRDWQDLCFDGQLWQLVHLAPMAHCMHIETLRRILTQAQSFVTLISLRGMDNLIGSQLIDMLSTIDGSSAGNGRFPSLTTLDLRGCKSLSVASICAFIQNAPHLTSINLKGVQAVSSEVIRCITAYTTQLEQLDVSRCCDLSLNDMVVFVESMQEEQSKRLTSLRLAGIKGYGGAAGKLLPSISARLVNLETLDLQDCVDVNDEDFKLLVERLDKTNQTSNLRHLNLSGCLTLTPTTLQTLTKRFPNMTHLELANMPDMFKERDNEDMYLVRLLRSMPHLRRLDLEGTGIGGGVTDKVLDALTPGRQDSEGTVGSELVELRIGFARSVTSEAMVRLMRGCTRLKIFEADNTSANNAVMRDFLRRRSSADASLCLIDCRSITPAAYASVAPSARPRQGWKGWSAVPFSYDKEIELSDKPVLKTFWSWKNAEPLKGWQQARNEAEGLASVVEGSSGEVGVDSTDGWEKKRRPGMGRRGSWWRTEDDLDDRAGCVVM